MSNNRYRYKLPPITILMMIIEFGTIIVAVLLFTRHLENWSPSWKLGGDEFSYLINSGTVAAEIYHRTGAIPLWNPFMGSGEPLFENPFSFVLNPLMTWPILWWGPIVGTKAALMIHILLMGAGGWALARITRLGTPGRILMGLLMVGSGSVTGAMNGGYFQLALSQAYVPWVMTGLIATLHMERRWPIALLAVSSTLLIFAGTFWYVLPTAIAAALFVVFGIVHWEFGSSKLHIDLDAAKRLVWATILIIGLSAIRLVPQFIHSPYVDHPLEFLNNTNNLTDILQLYFSVDSPTPDFSRAAIYFHYVVPFAFALLVVGCRFLASANGSRPALGRWRVIVPALLCVLIFSVWAQEGTPVLRWLYETIPFLREWRFVSRMGAAASIWVIVIIVTWFDDAIALFRQKPNNTASEATKPLSRVRRVINRDKVLRATAALLFIIGLISAADVLQNWQRLVGYEPANTELESTAMQYLRDLHPGEFLSALTPGFFGYFPFYKTLSRATFGNPDYHPRGITSTMGPDQEFRVFPEYAVGVVGSFSGTALHDWGYSSDPNGPKYLDADIVWVNEDALPYAFWLKRIDVPDQFSDLTRQETNPVTSLTHNIDSIQVSVDKYPAGAVLIVNETNYPGWQVKLNGQPATLESVGERLAVLLPEAGSTPTVINFEYRPSLLYQSALVSGLAFLLFVGYVLRADRFIPATWQGTLRKMSVNTLSRAAVALTDPHLFEHDEEEGVELPAHHDPTQNTDPTDDSVLVIEGGNTSQN